jgi:hypothetical protein
MPNNPAPHSCGEWRRCPYTTFLLTDLNRIPKPIAFCATAPAVRLSFFAVCGPDSFALANARRFLTSSFDHATTIRRFRFAIAAPFFAKAHIILPRTNKGEMLG